MIRAAKTASRAGAISEKGPTLPAHIMSTSFEHGHPDVARHVDFCAYLNAFPEQAARYSLLKQQLAGQVDHDIEAYLNGKGPLIQELDAMASEWRKSVG